MTNEELANIMQHSDADREFLNEIEETLRAELEKPVSERDFDLIADLEETISEMRGTEDTILARSEMGISLLKKHFTRTKTHGKPIRMRYLVAAACAIVLVTSNVLSYSVLGMNAFSAAVQIIDGGVTINFQESDRIELNEYAEDMLEICKKNGFTPMVPYYIPVSLTPTELWGKTEELNWWKITKFQFSHTDTKLLFQFAHISDIAYIPDIGVPTDSYQMSEEVVCGKNVYFFREDETEFKAVFMADQIQYSIYGDGLDEIEFRKVLYSMFT